MEPWQYAVGAFARMTVVPIMVAAILAVPLWICRRWFPRAERVLFGPLYNVTYSIGRAAGRAVRRLIAR
jgi:hypothetical protein